MNWLRQLTASEQVALLFVVLFGFLILLTVGLFLNSLRERADEHARLASQLTWERVRRDLREAKQYELADRIRDRLEELGIEVKDAAEDTTWQFR